MMENSDLRKACEELIRDCACDDDPIDDNDWGSVEWLGWVSQSIDAIKAALKK